MPAKTSIPKNKKVRLRRRSVLALLLHPFTLYPFLFSVGVLILLPVFRGYGVPLVVFGLLAALLGIVYNLVIGQFDGPSNAAFAAPGTEPSLGTARYVGPGLRRALESAEHSEDLVELYDRYELISHEVRAALNRPEASASLRDQFVPAIRGNDQTAIALFNNLVYIQEHLTKLIDSGARHGEMFEVRISQLRDQRARAMAHIDELVCILEQISVEVPKLSKEPAESARRQLEQLEDILANARQANRQMNDEV